MSILNIKKRITFIVFMIVSAVVLIFFNISDMLGPDDYSNRLAIICLIFFTALTFILYIVFEAYKVMYEEMAERVNTITANKNDLQTIYNSISMLLTEVNNEGVIVNANDSVCDFLGRKKNHIIGQTFSKAFSLDPDVRKIIEQMIDSSFHERVRVNEEIETGGNIFEVSVSVLQNFPDTENKALIILNDITQERAQYIQMMQDNKMIAVGHLAAGVAHEIRNPLGLIRTYSHLLKKNPGDFEIRKKAFPMIDYAVDRSSVIIDNLLGFSRLSNNTWEEIDMSATIKSVIGLEEYEFQNRNIDVIIQCPKDLKIYAIAESLQIILVNLINNAIDAIEKNGSITIICEKMYNSTIIKVKDTGIGIPEKIQRDIFNPFFTTKSNRNGSGLGLYIVYNEVMKLKGKIEVESKVGEGTSFVVKL